QSLVIRKEKGSILLYWPSRRSSELISLERRDLSVKEIPRVQGAVPKELIDIAVEGVRPGARHRVDYAARGAAVAGRIAVPQYGKLLHGIHAESGAEHTGWSAVGIIVDADAIQAITILVRPRSRNADCGPEAALSLGASRLDAGYPGLEGGELSPVAPVERRI